MSCVRVPPMKLLTIAILAMLPVLSAFAGPQSKRPQRDSGYNQQQDARSDRGQARDSSLSDAVRRVERDTRGEVLSAERVQYDGRDMHRVKVVDDEGRVRVFMQDPNRRDDSASDSGDDNRNDTRNSRRNSQRPRPTRGDDN